MIAFVLRASALVFVPIALGFLWSPEAMGRLVDVQLGSVSADNDLRAVYGGLQLGCASFLWICAGRHGWWRAGLAAQLLLFGGLVLGRLVSLVAVGLPGALGTALGSAELVGLAAGAWAWRQLDGQSGQR